ncbi:MAG: zinc-ribbon domain-containing protein [Lachnospiraceae bacterium]|nr:zinc-ribbon domain-containing protein [Lachnospiraceae bacterium]
MNETNVKSILKWLSIVLVFIAMLMMFCGAITVKDKDAKKELKKEVKSTLKEMKSSKDDIDDLQDELDDYDIDINAKKLFKQTKKILNALKDAKLSPSEVASRAPSIIKLAAELEDNDGLAYIMDLDDLDDMLEQVGNTKVALILFMILFYLTIIVAVITIILHFIDSKLPGVVITLLNLVWLIGFAVVAHKINVWAEDEIGIDEKLVRITAAPIWAFVLAALALALWICKDRIAEMLSSGAPSGGRVSGYSPSASTIKCPVCGNGLSAGAQFCPECGNKYVAPAPAPTPAPQPSSASAFCVSCGTKITSDTVFCPNCGARQ